MTLRLDDLVVSGELFNTSHYTVHGWLELRGTDRPLSLQLTGNPGPDLAGRHVRFEARSCPEPPPREMPDLSEIAWQQVGPTGTMTAEPDASAAEPRGRLFLEWFSQNGRMVVELVDPLIEFVDDAADSPSNDSLEDEEEGFDEAEDSGVLSAESDEAESTDDEDDPYGLFSDELQQSLDAHAYQLEREISADEDSDRTIRELELMDDLIENGDGEPINTLFDTPLKLPRPDEVDEQSAEAALKTLLARLALYGIALDICPHYSPREAYRLLIEEICVESRAYPELRQTQWVQHFMTSEYCDACDAEMQIEFDEEDRRSEDSPSDGRSDDDLPF